MSFQGRNGRSDNRSRVTPQNGRRGWVPRGSNVVNQPLSSGLNSNRDGGESNGAPMQGINWQQRSSNSRSHMGRPPNHRRDREGGGRERERTRLPKGNKDEGDDGEGLKASNLNLPQLVQEIQEKLTKGTVECMICYDMVRRSAPIWSCSSCYSIFHLNCIKKWARAPTSINLMAETSQGFNWRCPGCQSVQLTSSKEI